MTKIDTYAKSPLNYTGGKYRLLPQLFEYMPKEYDTFIDLFCGGGNVVANVKANKRIANDNCKQLIELYKYFQSNSPEKIIEGVKDEMSKFNLIDGGAEAYYEYMKHHNENKTPLSLFTVQWVAFNNFIRFNSKGDYNVAYGRNLFSDAVIDRIINLVDKIKSVEFTSMDFSEINEEGFYYIDPPYLITIANYGNHWNEDREKELLNYVDKINERGNKFALSNVIEHKGKINNILIDWIQKYNVHYLNKHYKHCYPFKNTGKTVEVLITNY